MNNSDRILSAAAAEAEEEEEEDDSATVLAPGFRFHPTDDELVTYYLKRKILNKPLLIDAIGEVDLYKSEPWDLPAKSKIKSRDLEWYFFSPLDRKQSNNRLRTNRGTEMGYWKTTGKDREVRHGGKVVGMKKTLVYHQGRAPRGKRTNWVMHEYRLDGSDGVVEESYVVCRIFQKTGPGPQNGAQYGAPFVEEEWDKLTPGGQNNNNNNLFVINAPGQQDCNDDCVDESNDVAYLQMTDLLQNQDASNNSTNPPLHFPSELETIISQENQENQENQKNQENHSSTVLDASSPAKTPDEFLELNDLASDLLSLPNDDQTLNETLNFDDFFEPSDSLMQMSEVIYSPQMSVDFVDEFLTYYDAPDDNLFYDDFGFDSNKVINENVSNGIQAGASSSVKLQEGNNNMFSENEDLNILSDKKPLGKFASFLDSFSAPPAFAEEFPASSSKLATSATSKSLMDPVRVDPVHLTSNLIQIGNDADVELLLSYKFDSNPKYHCGVSAVLRGGFCMFLLSAFMLLVSYKIGLCVCEH
ncbi:hypothetical protein LUZ60_012161 [Juncus effusus]|nr:hypothetical protein LUZ60_012161 [Juncus effusus]